MSKKRRKRCQSFRMITTPAYTVRSETTNNYIYIQNYIKLLIKIWPYGLHLGSLYRTKTN